MFERDRGAVDPAVRGGGLHHRVFTAHVVRRERNVERVTERGDHIEVRQCRFHHDHVCALGEIERGLIQCLAPVRGLHLIAAAIAELRCTFRRIAERPVERGGVLRGVGQDGAVRVIRRVQRVSDGADLAVHHAARRNHISPGIGLGDRNRRVALQRGVVVHLARRGQEPAMPVVGVLVQAGIGHQHERIADLVAQVAQRHLHHAVRVVRGAPPRVLGRRDPEQDHPGDPEICQCPYFLAQTLLSVLHHARHRDHGIRFADALLDEERGDEIIDVHAGLRNQPT